MFAIIEILNKQLQWVLDGFVNVSIFGLVLLYILVNVEGALSLWLSPIPLEDGIRSLVVGILVFNFMFGGDWALHVIDR